MGEAARPDLIVPSHNVPFSSGQPDGISRWPLVLQTGRTHEAVSNSPACEMQWRPAQEHRPQRVVCISCRPSVRDDFLVEKFKRRIHFYFNDLTRKYVALQQYILLKDWHLLNTRYCVLWQLCISATIKAADLILRCSFSFYHVNSNSPVAVSTI